MGISAWRTAGAHRDAVRTVSRGGLAWAAVALVAIGASACGSSAAAGTATNPDPTTVRLGYLTNLTHAPALVGVSKGYFQSSLPSGTTLSTKSFSAGPAESEALLGGSLDAAFVGPNPAISGFLATQGKGIRIVAGAASGGAGLVVTPALATGAFPLDLNGQTLATPQLGNTQDVALRSWLRQNGLTAGTTNGGGQVNVDSSSGNSLDLQRFVAHQIAGGWEPEPYESEYILKGHGTLAVDEASLWPGGQFPTTVLVVSTPLLVQHPDIVRDLLKGLIQSVDWINHNTAAAQAEVNSDLASVTGGKLLPTNVVQLAWTHLKFGVDPLAADLRTDADHAHVAGVIPSANVHGIMDLSPLNALLTAAGRPALDSAGLSS
jgi:NitT/TauT family transport system substrate-binding protein